jgi:hypothetical protein
MKFSFRSFVIGFGCAALSLGAVTYANAASNGTLKACANKSTGAMRYISKGSCKKTETSLSWSQMGPQGLPGAAGAAGTSGTDGAKGDSGTAGSNGTAGTNGTNGQNLFLVNSDGSEVGQIASTSGTSATVMFDKSLWDVDLLTGLINTSARTYWIDAACSLPVAYVSSATIGVSNIGVPAPTQLVVVDIGFNGSYDSTDKVYKMTGIGLSMASRNNVYRKGNTGTCDEWTASEKTMFDTVYKGGTFALTEILNRPTLIAPLRIVAK